MSQPSQILPPLIVDPEVKFTNSLSQDPIASKIVPVFAHSGNEAQVLLSNKTHLFSAIFINPDITNPCGISVIRSSHYYHPTVPVFFISDKQLPFTDKELLLLGIQKALSKPLTYHQLIEYASPNNETTQRDSLLPDPNPTKHQEVELDMDDSQFLPIQAKHFVAGTNSFFNIYIRLSRGKYIKLLNAGDNLSSERVRNFLKKGIVYLFIKKEAQEHYLSYCDQLTAALLEKKIIPLDIKISQTLRHGEEVLKFFKLNGISPKNIDHATQFLGNVTSLVKQLNPGKNPMLKAFLADSAAFDHGVGVTLIASLLSSALNNLSVSPVETIGIAGLFHDVGIRILFPNQADVDEDKYLLDDSTKELYFQHPLAGVDLLRKIPKIHPSALLAVEQHHERINRRGFPNQLGQGSISIISEIVGISDELNRIIKRMNTQPNFDLSHELELRILHSFSPTVIEVFKKSFTFESPPT